jgi:signal peptidase I
VRPAQQGTDDALKDLTMQSMAPTAPLIHDGPPGGRAQRVLARAFWAGLVPAIVAALTLRYLMPARLEGAPGGIIAFVGRLADENPLIMYVVAFVAASETIQYWRGVRSGSDPTAAQVPTPRSGNRRTKQIFALALAGGLALAMRTWVVQTYRVEGGSMLPTLQLSDRLLVNKLAYRGGRLPKRGDIVVLRANALPDFGDDRLLVKRVIGLPGDRISVIDGRPVINGWPTPVCDGGPFADIAGPRVVTGRIGVEYLDHRGYLTTWTPMTRSTPEFTVPAGHVYVMGDYRAISQDSRTGDHGKPIGVALDKIEGRVSRVVLGGQRDGRLDFSRVLSALDLHLHEPGVDATSSEERIAGCIMAQPPDTTPPPAR